MPRMLWPSMRRAMKKSKIKLSANVLAPDAQAVPGMLACTGPLEEVFPRLRSMGYEGVELITVDPITLDLAALDRLLAAWNLEMVAVNTGRLCGQMGLTLADPDPEIRREALSRTKEVMDFASHWGAPINMGILRGRFREGVPHEDTMAWMVDGLKELCGYGAARNVPIAIETVCFMQSNTVNTLAQAEELIRRVDSPLLGVMYDIFQMYLEERDLCLTVKEHISRCLHVHFADSNRLAPGRGAIDWGRLLAALRDAGYQGPASIELRPEPDQFTAARQAAETLLPHLAEW